MTIIRSAATVGSDGNVTVAVGIDQAGKTVEVTVTPSPQPETINGLPADQWWEIFNRTEGSIDDPGFVRPPQGPYEPRRAFD